MSKEDLKGINERLGKALGFQYYISPHNCKWPDGTVAPIPDFISSMDACIKWIYPFLHEPVEIGNIKGGWCCRIGRSGWFRAESISEAFCLAAYKSLEEIK